VNLSPNYHTKGGSVTHREILMSFWVSYLVDNIGISHSAGEET